jgi:transposase
MKGYSLDLRERVVSIYEREQTKIKEAATRFSVGDTFVKKCSNKSVSAQEHSKRRVTAENRVL